MHPHLPVLYQEIIHAIQPGWMEFRPVCIIDGTVGAGGHAWGILDASGPDSRLLGLDLDPQALHLAQSRLAEYGERVVLKLASYIELDSQMAQVGWESVSAVVLDLGASSMQFDSPERGFSFQADGPLDMRFSPSNPQTAADLVNHLAEDELADLIWRYGEDPHSRRIARGILRSRPLQTTRQLAEVVQQAVGGKRGKLHPATLTFQALRIAVNRELDSIQTVLPKAIAALRPGGRLAVIAFHSLEDRLVKQYFQKEARDCLCPPEQPICTCSHRASIRRITHHPIEASSEEINRNPRARSAKLRVAEKLTELA